MTTICRLRPMRWWRTSPRWPLSNRARADVLPHSGLPARIHHPFTKCISDTKAHTVRGAPLRWSLEQWTSYTGVFRPNNLVPFKLVSGHSMEVISRLNVTPTLVSSLPFPWKYSACAQSYWISISPHLTMASSRIATLWWSITVLIVSFNSWGIFDVWDSKNIRSIFRDRTQN